MNDYQRWQIAVKFVTDKLNEYKAATSDLRTDAIPGTAGMTVWQEANRSTQDLQTALSVLMRMDV